MATLVLDEDTLQPLFRWKTKNELEDRVIGASPAMAAAWQDVRGEKRIVIRKPGDKDWKTSGGVELFYGRPTISGFLTVCDGDGQRNYGF